MRAGGVRRIEGQVVGREGLFPGERRGAGWNWADLVWGYGAEASALSFADNCVRLRAAPGARPGDPLVLGMDPESAYFNVVSSATTSPRGSEEDLTLTRQADSTVIHLSGTLGLGAPAWEGEVALPDPARWTATVFREVLVRAGIEVTGGVATSSAPLPPTRELAAHLSPPLSELVAEVNKQSRNPRAEMLLRLLGARVAGAGTPEGGHQAVLAFLARLGVPTAGFALEDGSGLARADLVTAHGLTSLLAAASREPWAGVFRGSLPVAGVDGTLEHRMRGTLAAGRVRAKTGTLRHVSALAGYLMTRSGRPLAFTVILAHHDLETGAANAAIDAVVEVLAGS